MDVPVYESERRIILRIVGQDPQIMRRVPIRSFDPIPAESFVGPAGFWNEVDAAGEPTAICVAPPGSTLVERNGRRYLSALLPKLDKARPTVVDADSLLTWCKVGAYGLRLADRPARVEAEPMPDPVPTPEPTPEPEPELVHAGPADEPEPPPGFLF